jgi:sarcosine oxidase, subunit beta
MYEHATPIGGGGECICVQSATSRRGRLTRARGQGRLRTPVRTSASEMPGSVDVIVIGGGVFGTSAALHLLTGGAGDVALLERDAVGQGTSAAGAGFIDPWAAGSNPHLGPEELAVEAYGLDLYARLGEEHRDLSYFGNGCLWVAIDEAQWDRLTPMLDYPSVQTDVLQPNEVAALTDLVCQDSVVRGIYHRDSGHVSAPGAARCLAGEFVRAGGRVLERQPVVRLIVEAGRVRGVETSQGRLLSDRVVMAAGAWCNELLSDHGVFLPIVPLVVSRILTEPLGVPASTPAFFVPGVADGEDEVGYLYARGESGRLLWGAHYSCSPRTMFVDRPVAERFDQLPLDGVEELRRAAARAAPVVPLLGSYRSTTVAHGVPCYTADNRSLVGPVPELEGLFVLAGCNEMGVTHAPGFGKIIADMIVHGESALAPADAWRPDRFDGQLSSARDVLRRVDGAV